MRNDAIKKQDKFIYHGQHSAPTEPGKLFFLANLLIALLVTAWLGLQSPGSTARQLLLIGCAAIFILRTAFMVVYLNPRRFGWREAAGDALVVWLVAYGLVVYWGGADVPLGWLDGLALLLFVAGSVLTTGSELARARWKSRPENQGRLYTQGAFRYARHINYFGEVVSFTGFAILTRYWWAAIVPLLMLLFFIFMHISALDRHLREHYPEAYPEYRRNTKKLIPFIY